MFNYDQWQTEINYAHYKLSKFIKKNYLKEKCIDHDSRDNKV